MSESSAAHFHLDHPAEGATVPAGPILVRGWAVAKPGHFLTDLRLRLNGRTFPVFYGHPRPDLARHFGAREPFLLAGFEVELELAAGENRLEFDGCFITGDWRPVATPVLYGIDVQFEPLVRHGIVYPHEWSRALRLVLQRAIDEPVEAAARAVADLLPFPFVTRFPALPFHGHLHHPPMLMRADFGRLIVEGWLFHECERIKRVAATVDLQVLQPLEQLGDHPYVSSLYPDQPNAGTSRIHGFIDIPSQLPQPVSLRTYAQLPDDSWTLCHVQRSHLYDIEQNKAPYPPLRPLLFWRASRALHAACRARGYAVPLGKGILQASREVWDEYAMRAPRRPWCPAPAPDLTADGKSLRHVTLVSHNLNYEGAPLFLFEYAAHLAARGIRLAVISQEEGPLRARYEALGAAITIVEGDDLLVPGKDRGALRRALARIYRQVNLAGTDLVVANTVSAYWGIHLAHRAGRPSLLYIHESTTPDCFFLGRMQAGHLAVVKHTFTLASHVSFLTESTRRYYRAQLTRPNHSINPGWIDLAAIDRFRREHDRAGLRSRLGLGSDRVLVINVGTVCERKGQHIFARAADLLWRDHPELAARCEFLMIGGRDTAYDKSMAELLAWLDRPNLRVVAETGQPYVYYGAADLFVCSSYEESFPRVVLEAMAFQLPIVSTSVHGIPEMTRPDGEAVLVPAGHGAALAAAMARVLLDTAFSATLAERARTRVAAEYDSARLLPRHAALASFTAAAS
jgi:glycosyltransferase involved in cell wall biosynthesis